jgi:hypothetical protein
MKKLKITHVIKKKNDYKDMNHIQKLNHSTYAFL